jgi:hypothetical protein
VWIIVGERLDRDGRPAGEKVNWVGTVVSSTKDSIAIKYPTFGGADTTAVFAVRLIDALHTSKGEHRHFFQDAAIGGTITGLIGAAIGFGAGPWCSENGKCDSPQSTSDRFNNAGTGFKILAPIGAFFGGLI